MARSLQNPILENIGRVGRRAPQASEGFDEALGVVPISADSHYELSEDIFFENFPERLKADAPRVWHDCYWRIGYREGTQAQNVGEKLDRVLQSGIGPGAWDTDKRVADMRIEGIGGEIIYPQSLLGFVRYPNFEVQEWMYRTYNEHIAERLMSLGAGHNPVAIFSNWWDPAKAEAAMQQIVDLGFKTFMIPITHGKDVTGKSLYYGDEELNRFWDVVDEAGLPVSFHVGEGLEKNHRGGIATSVITSIDPFRKPFAQLVFGGVFDRHPDLKVVFAEGGIAWVAAALQDAEMIYDSFGNEDLDGMEPIEHRPSHYWHHNCYATFQNDQVGLKLLEYIGADRVMWAADYPHNEGSFGYSRLSRQAVVAATPLEDARKILGATALQVYNLKSLVAAS